MSELCSRDLLVNKLEFLWNLTTSVRFDNSVRSFFCTVHVNSLERQINAIVHFASRTFLVIPSRFSNLLL